MGYYMTQIDNSFRIKSENVDKGLENLKDLCMSDTYLKWINKENILNASTLDEAMESCLYDLEHDNYGNVVGIQFSGEKIGREKIIFNAIAPVVEKDSYITVKGEDGLRWEWYFKKGKCKERTI